MTAAFTVFSREQTAALLDFPSLVDAVAAAAQEFDAGRIISPDRLVVPLGEGGVMLSMPAAAADLGVLKLVNVQPANRKLDLPTIHGMVTVCDGATGRPLCVLDGPELTGRRTAAVTLLAVRRLLPSAPRAILIIGTGVQASHHVEAFTTIYPDAQVWVRGIDAASTEAFCRGFVNPQRKAAALAGALPDEVDVVVTLTTSTEPVYNEPARAGRVVIGVGAFKPEMAEIGKTTLDGSILYADDPAAAKHEAGDLMRAGVDWSRVKTLAALLREAPDLQRPAVFKSVGTAAWDLAAARVAVAKLQLSA